MGEIKSTLDLVMERTRHLSLTAEEKAQQQRTEFEKRLKGLLQQYADEILTARVLMKRLDALKAETGVDDAQPVLTLIYQRVDPDEDNQAWINLLASLLPEGARPLDDLLVGYRDQKAVLLRAGKQKAEERLARDHAIHGSAVLPDPMQDDTCRQQLATLREKALEQIGAFRARAKI